MEKPPGRRIRSHALNAIELIEFTRNVADDVTRGKYPLIEYDAETRWHQRIYRDAAVDVWLISWMPSQGTQLDDHGGSAGSFTVVSGELAEAVYDPTDHGSDTRGGELQEHTRTAGCSVGFDVQYVHDVRNLSLAPAVSVHAGCLPRRA
ncbi:MAG: cysteine dioxygenase family protein [Pseudonocardiales bacterium]